MGYSAWSTFYYAGPYTTAQTHTYCPFSSASPENTQNKTWEAAQQLCRICTHNAYLIAHIAQTQQHEPKRWLTVLPRWCSGAVKYAWQRSSSIWSCRCCALAAMQPPYTNFFHVSLRFSLSEHRDLSTSCAMFSLLTHSACLSVFLQPVGLSCPAASTTQSLLIGAQPAPPPATLAATVECTSQVIARLSCNWALWR